MRNQTNTNGQAFRTSQKILRPGYFTSKSPGQYKQWRERFELHPDDPKDMAFWAEQFETSEEDLRKAALAAGTSIDNITSYLQY